MNVLTHEDLAKAAPSIFALEPWQKMSEKYRFVPTIKVVEALRDSNFLPVRATQSRTRIAGKGEFTKHMIRFRQPMDINSFRDEEVPELVLVNSHDGSSAYKLMFGIFRIVCSNGLVVATSNLSDISVRHQGARSLPQQVIDASFQIINEAPAVMRAVADWKAIQLTGQQELAYATSALELRDSALKLDPWQLLQARRRIDRETSLWSTFNKVQENVIKGGNRGVSSNGRKIKTRSIKSVTEDLRLNRALWKLTEEMAKIIKA